MKIYVAAQWVDKKWARVVADVLRSKGHEVTSSWLDLDEANTTKDKSDHAGFCLRDIDRAEAVLSLTLPPGTMHAAGGRHNEFGYALGRPEHKHLVILGERETVFHHLPMVQQFDSLEETLDFFNHMSVQR